MPMQPAPPDDLNTLLNLPDGQVVDVIALVLDVTPPETKTTQYGRRDLVNISILDDSGENGAAISVFPAWFPKSTSGDHCAALKKLMDASKSADPVAFFNLICQKEEPMPSASEHGATAKTVLKTSREKFTFEISTEGPKAVRLKTNADKLRATGKYVNGENAGYT